MFNKVSYRRGVIEGVILYTLGRLGALITPAFFPDWVYVIAPLFFLILQFLVAPFWATRRITSTKRERLSKRFWLLGPRMAAICFCIDLFISLAIGLALFTFEVCNKALPCGVSSRVAQITSAFLILVYTN